MKGIPVFFGGFLGTLMVAFAEPRPLFDGATLEGFDVQGESYWSAEGGVLTGRSDERKLGSILWTEKSYRDFVLELEFRFEGHTDSGVFLRKESEQIQIGISGSEKRDMTCSPYIGCKRGYPVEAKGVAELLDEGGWNRMRIVAKGPEYTVFLKNREVMRYRSESAGESGPIGFQVHPGLEMTIEFRNLSIEPLE